jgi:hypothetical protein
MSMSPVAVTQLLPRNSRPDRLCADLHFQGLISFGGISTIQARHAIEINVTAAVPDKTDVAAELGVDNGSFAVPIPVVSTSISGCDKYELRAVNSPAFLGIDLAHTAVCCL